MIQNDWSVKNCQLKQAVHSPRFLMECWPDVPQCDEEFIRKLLQDRSPVLLRLAEQVVHERALMQHVEVDIDVWADQLARDVAHLTD